MAFSDDEEEEHLPVSVSNYFFHDENEETISFSELPVQLDGKEKEKLAGGSGKRIYLRGLADGGLLNICKLVTAWKFDLSNVGKPEISVLSKENGWVKLEKPRKIFEPEIRSILITVHCLHFLSWNPDLSGNLLWEQLAKAFSLYEVKPSQNDLVDHMELIGEAVKSGGSLAKSKFLNTFLEEKPRRKKLADEDVRATPVSGFIVDDEDNVIDSPDKDDSDDDGKDDDLFDSVCAFCDNGGNLLCCEGKCMRSFHATVEAGEESACESLGFTLEEVEAIQTFLCENCQYNIHQCYVCGKLGSSDKSSGAEVFRCSNATCGHFYHPDCVAKLLHKRDKSAAEELGKKISAGELFTCPIHKCYVCQQGENKKVEELQFALCRRCPKSYHRKCLPREIAFEDIDEEGIIMRAWDDLLVNRVLIYCTEHEIMDDIGTPERDHVKFPPVNKKMKRTTSDSNRSDETVGLKKRLEDYSGERTAMKAAKQLSSVGKDHHTGKKSESIIPRKNSIGKVRGTAASLKPLKGNSKSVSVEVGKSSTADEHKISLGERLFRHMTMESEQVKHEKQDTLKGGLKMTKIKSTAKKLDSGMPSLDAESQRRLLALVKETEASLTLEDIISKHKVPSTHAYSSRNVVDKTITFGKIEVSAEAVRMALAKLEDGCSMEDAQVVCEPEVLNQIFKWQNKLRVYLSPFLYGLRYTSFGRHFTKVDKLKEIVDRLHWYVQDGDTIVDFCCGANDFSLLLKGRLEEMGKKCSYKNYDIFPTKNNFNLEIRDWMTVQPKELPEGSRLIMGLNPPFGVKAALANKFIDKALQFNPKLLILIVPPETQRLDEKKFVEFPYELVWEDNRFLSGKSFYLPGSVNENERQMDQWNMIAPPLYLWSRADFSAKHKAIAEEHGHLPREPKSSNQERNINELHLTQQPLDDVSHSNEASELQYLIQSPEGEEHRPDACMTLTPKECSPHWKGERETQDSHGHVKNQSSKPSMKRKKHDGEISGRGTDVKSPVDGQSGGRTPTIEISGGIPYSSPSKLIGGRSLMEGVSSKSPRRATPAWINEDVYPPLDHGSYVQFGTSYDDTSYTSDNDMGRRYSIYDNDPYLVGAHNLGYRPDPAALERDIRAPVHPYGYEQDPAVSTQRYYQTGVDSLYSAPSSVSNPSYATADPYDRMNTSAMQRYAPRLDELNYTRMGDPRAEPPPMGSINTIYDPRPPPPIQFPIPDYRTPRPPQHMGFAPGPFHHYSHHGSAGWLND